MFGLFESDGGKKGVAMEKETKAELYEKAKRYNIVGRSKMNKAALIQAIRQKQKEIGETRYTKKSKS